MKKSIHTLFILFAIFSTSVKANNISEATNIINSIVGKCKTEGMLSCEPHIKEVNIAFDYIRLFNTVSIIENDFNNFVKNKYSINKPINKALQASLKLKLNVTFNPEQFTSGIRDSIKVKDGFDVYMSDGSIYELRNEGNSWVMIFPIEMQNKLKQLEPYIVAAKIKRAILLYRMQEADMANLSFDKFNENIGQDLGPLIVAMFGKDKYPDLAKLATKELNSIINFYSQFSTNQDMIKYIKKDHNL